MALDNFAILCQSISGGLVTTACSDGSPRGDVGIATSAFLTAIDQLTVGGAIRFAGAESVIGGGTFSADAVSVNDSLVGIIQSIPTLVASYLTAASSGNMLPLTPTPGSTIILLPGMNFVPGDFTSYGNTFLFVGSVNDSYVLAVFGDLTITIPTFLSFPTDFTVAIGGQLNFNPTAAGDALICGAWIAGGLGGINTGGDSLTIAPGRLVTANLFRGGFGASGIDGGAILSVTSPPFAFSNVILPGSLANIALTNPALCH
jgi:hypothetical protein